MKGEKDALLMPSSPRDVLERFPVLTVRHDCGKPGYTFFFSILLNVRTNSLLAYLDSEIKSCNI